MFPLRDLAGVPMDTRAGAGYAARWTTEGTSGVKTVTEAEWLASTDPQLMLTILEPWAADGVVSDRQLRLFVCASCRRLWHLLGDQTRQNNVELAERFVDGKASEEEIMARRREIYLADESGERSDEPTLVRWCVLEGTGYGGPDVYRQQIEEALLEKHGAEEDAGQAALLRDIFGNPFRPITIPPAVLAWNNATVVHLAQAAYEERHLPSGTLDNGRLVVLADALEEAGCTDADILGHLRGSGPHVRGCWVVDALLDKSRRPW